MIETSDPTPAGQSPDASPPALLRLAAWLWPAAVLLAWLLQFRSYFRPILAKFGLLP